MDLRKEDGKQVLNQDFESTLESVDTAESLILEASEKAGFDEDELNKIGMSVRECMVNAVVHGNRYSANKKVHVVVYVYPAALSITISDQGEGFQLSDLPDPSFRPWGIFDSCLHG
jgi:serine/threonine-protein kinase RsbW